MVATEARALIRRQAANQIKDKRGSASNLPEIENLGSMTLTKISGFFATHPLDDGLLIPDSFRWKRSQENGLLVFDLKVSKNPGKHAPIADVFCKSRRGDLTNEKSRIVCTQLKNYVRDFLRAAKALDNVLPFAFVLRHPPGVTLSPAWVYWKEKRRWVRFWLAVVQTET